MTLKTQLMAQPKREKEFASYPLLVPEEAPGKWSTLDNKYWAGVSSPIEGFWCAEVTPVGPYIGAGTFNTIPISVDYSALLASISDSLPELVARVTSIEASSHGAQKQNNVFIATLSPEPYDLKRTLPVNIQRVDHSFTATFFDANISSSGETEEEAFSNLKALICETFDYLSSVPEEQLGPEPLRQLAVLSEFVGAQIS